MSDIKPKVGFIGCGFVGGAWVSYLERERQYIRGQDFFCYDPGKNMFDDVNQANIVVISVPTPDKNGQCDLSIVYEAVARVKDGKWVVLRSTVPPGTTARLQKKYPSLYFIYIPEFLTESRAEEDFRNPDRVIIALAGTNFQIVDTLLSLFPRARTLSVPGYVDTYNWLDATSTEAEMAKSFGNVMGAIKVTLAEIFSTDCRLLAYQLAEEGIDTRVDYDRVRKMVATDYRIGDAHLQSGHGGYRGFGGYCFIKDTYARRSAIVDRLVWVQSLVTKCGGGRELDKLWKLGRLLRHNVEFFDAMLASNAALLNLQGLTELEAMTHAAALSDIIKNRELKDVEDYLPETVKGGK
ncbi:MAG: hypothetical protein Q7S32_00920 [bacterium]|nr:hypothetical protein [bacterium]